MLVFRRKVGESVVIDGRIEVQLLEVTGSRVKLGFTAPPEVTVMRKELFLTREENRRAARFRATESFTRLVSVLRSPAPDAANPQPPPPRFPILSFKFRPIPAIRTLGADPRLQSGRRRKGLPRSSVHPGRHSNVVFD